MLITKRTIRDESGDSYIEAIYESSNILRSIFFPEKQKLYVSFNRGETYSYENIDNIIYSGFENAESQGKYLNSNIKSDTKKHPVRKEFSLYPSEIKEINEIKETIKKDEESKRRIL